MQTKKIIVTKTQKYAKSLPHLPHLCLYKGQTLDVEALMADRVIELGGAKEVIKEGDPDPVETDVDETDDDDMDEVTARRQDDAEFEESEMDTEQSNMPDIEVKEKTKKKGRKKGNKR